MYVEQSNYHAECEVAERCEKAGNCKQCRVFGMKTCISTDTY
jgi:hypothetical protein